MAQAANNTLAHWWWKILAIVLLIFASIVALRAPLAPALINVHPDRAGAGATEFTVTGYNTQFDEAYQVYLINGEDRICPLSVEAIAPNKLVARFAIPYRVKEIMSSVVVHRGDGRLGLPGAIYHANTGAGVADPACQAAATAIIGDADFNFPNRSILYESIRNLNFHVPMWFTMMVLMAVSLGFSLMSLGRNDIGHDRAAAIAVRIGLLFCALGLVTGSVWARATWGAWWTNDVKLNGAAVTALIYLAYLVLRGSVAEPYRRAKLAGIYNIFAFMLLVLFLLVLPRLNAIDSLHPGSGGNPAFNQYDLDDDLRKVFYPAVAGWIFLGLWMFRLRLRAERLKEWVEERDHPISRPIERPAQIKHVPSS